MCKNKRNTLGLLVLLAFSIAMAGGRKPKEEAIQATMIILSRDEIRTAVEHLPTDDINPPTARRTLGDIYVYW